MDDEKIPSGVRVLLFGALAGVGVYYMKNGLWEFIGRLVGVESEGTQARADQNLKLNAARIFSKKLDIPVNRILQVLDDPKNDTKLWSQMTAIFENAEVMFSLVDDKDIIVSLEIAWSDGKKTTGKQTWKESQVPKDVVVSLREENEPVIFDWKLSEDA